MSVNSPPCTSAESNSSQQVTLALTMAVLRHGLLAPSGSRLDDPRTL